MQAREPGFSALGGGPSGLIPESGMTIYSGVCTFNPGRPRVLGGAMIVPLTCASLLCAKAPIDTTMITNAVITKKKLLFIYVSLFAQSCDGRCRCRPSRLGSGNAQCLFRAGLAPRCSVPISDTLQKASALPSDSSTAFPRITLKLNKTFQVRQCTWHSTGVPITGMT